MRTLWTHDGVFHADDVLATAILTWRADLDGEHLRVLRTRDLPQEEIPDYIVDVGGRCETVRLPGGKVQYWLDHHQAGGAGSQEGIPELLDLKLPLASAGLCWKQFGPGILRDAYPELSDTDRLGINRAVLTRLVIPADCADSNDDRPTGVTVAKAFLSGDLQVSLPAQGGHPERLAQLAAWARCRTQGVAPLGVAEDVRGMNPSWGEVSSPVARYNRFLKGVASLLASLKRTADRPADVARARGIVRAALETARAGPQPEVVILERFCPWQEHLQEAGELAAQARYVLFPDNVGTWKLSCVPGPDRAPLTPLPAEWAGKEKEALEVLTGVKGGFCHRGRHLAGAPDEEGVRRLVALALEEAAQQTSPREGVACP